MNRCVTTTAHPPAHSSSAGHHRFGPGWFAVLDVGGTGSRLRLTGPSRTALVADAPGRTLSAAGIDTGALLGGVAEALRRLRAEHPEQVPGGFEAAGVGMSGLLGLTTGHRQLTAELAQLFGAQRVVLASDMLTAHVGALVMRPGAVIAAGTGAVALGTDMDAQWLRSDGWGHLLGDEGSGSWIGMQGLRAATRSHDGRPGGSRTLLRLATDRFGPPRELPARLYPHGDVAGRMAAFAPDVADAARAGDPVARRIWQRAAEHLARTVVSALPEHTPPVVSWCGRLFAANDLLTEPFRAAVLDAVPDASIMPPAGTPLDGAERLARLAALAPRRLPHTSPYLHVHTA